MGWTKTGTIPATAVTDANVAPQISGGTATGVALAAKIAAGITGKANASDLISEGALRVSGDAATLASAIADALTKYQPRTTGTVAALTYPLVIAHRGASNLFPENTMLGFHGSLALGVQAIEAGDIQSAADGGLVCMHDLTVNRTTTAVGNVSTLNTPAVKRLVADASSWLGGGQVDTTVPTFADILAGIGGQTVIFPEVKDVSDATATAMCAAITKAGLKNYAVVVSAALSNLAIVTAAGIAACYETFSTGASASPATLAAAGIGFATIDVGSDTSGALTTWVTNMKAAGIKTIAGTVDHQKAYDLAISQGFDAVYSNDPIYASRNYAKYRRSSTLWAQNGTWSHGMARTGGSSDIPLTPTDRGSFIGAAGAWRWAPPGNVFVGPGDVNPVPSPAGTYTVTTIMAFDSLPTTTSQGANVFVAAPTDNDLNIAGNVPNCYLAKMRQTGVVNCWAIDAAGSAAAIGSITTTVPSIPVLSSGLTSGAAITSIPVNALTVALKVGHQFYLPTGQVVTLTAAAAVSATSLTVASVTPSAAVPTATGLIPRITISIAITPTQVTITRTDEAAAGNVSVANATQRGGYIHLQNAVTPGAGSVSFESVTIT